MDPEQLQQKFLDFAAELRALPVPQRGANAPCREIKMGGHNE
jgi:hypothetical protein